MDNKKYDIIIIGSGPGGYVAAIRAGQLGFKTAIIERYATLGGTCLNVGCIPSKALLDSSEHYDNCNKHFKTHGIEVDNLRADLGQMIKRKNEVVAHTVNGVNFLMKKNKIDVYHGHASFANANSIDIALNDGTKTSLESKYFVIATGSKPASLPSLAIDKKRIITSTEALNLTEIPKTLAIIGGGVIGLELGSVYARLGTQVSVIEYMDAIVPSMDRELGKELQKLLTKKLGFKFFLSHKVMGATNNGASVTITANNAKDEAQTFEADYCLVSVGRKPYTDGLNLDKAGVTLDNRGRINVDDHLQTSVPHIYAIGDVIRGAMLAHKASDEGVFVIERLAGQKPHINYLAIPGVVYTWPEAASVGYTEEELKQKSVAYKSGKFPFMASGRARAAMEIDGFIKVLADKTTDEILGVHMLGARAADMIGEAVLALEFRASAEDVGIISHAHPTFTESLKEAALAATSNRALHL